MTKQIIYVRCPTILNPENAVLARCLYRVVIRTFPTFLIFADSQGEAIGLYITEQEENSLLLTSDVCAEQIGRRKI